MRKKNFRATLQFETLIVVGFYVQELYCENPVRCCTARRSSCCQLLLDCFFPSSLPSITPLPPSPISASSPPPSSSQIAHHRSLAMIKSRLSWRALKALPADVLPQFSNRKCSEFARFAQQNGQYDFNMEFFMLGSNAFVVLLSEGIGGLLYMHKAALLLCLIIHCGRATKSRMILLVGG